MRTNVDEVVKAYGVKHLFIESGKYSIERKIEEQDCPCCRVEYNPMPTYWCELSWGCGDEEDGDLFDAAVNAFGMSVDDAIKNCLDLFDSLVKENSEPYPEIAKFYNIKV